MSFLTVGDVFKTVDINFALFEQYVQTDICPIPDIPASELVDISGALLPFEDLPARAQAEALLPILAAASVNLRSTLHLSLIQDIYGRMVFHSRTNLVPFNVIQKGSTSQLTVKARAHLHGKHLTEHIGVSEEAFIRFVIFTDILRYHSDQLKQYVDKYRSYLSASDYHSVSDQMKSYDGGISSGSKLIKGYRDTDIRRFLHFRTVTQQERRNLTSVGVSRVPPFVFNYPEAAAIKSESGSLKKRKADRIALSAISDNKETMAMCFDDDDDDDDHDADTFQKV